MKEFVHLEESDFMSENEVLDIMVRFTSFYTKSEVNH